MPFYHSHIICLGDTDAAGVVYFATTLHLCHIAYEAALAAVDLPLGKVLDRGDLALPITHCTSNFRRPLRCSDSIVIQVMPQSLSETEFVVAYTILATDRDREPRRIYAEATTHHTCIDPQRRRRLTLPDWLREGLNQIAQMEAPER